MLELRLENDTRSFFPGQKIRGKALWQLDHDPCELEIRLFWYTAGKGTVDAVVIATDIVENPGLSGEKDFSFEAPDGPFSCSGTLVSVIWGIELVDISAGEAVLMRLVVSSDGKEIRFRKTGTGI